MPALRWLSVVAVLLTARQASAQLQFAGDAPQVYSIQPREHRFMHELHMEAGFLPNNAYALGLAVIGGYTYHFNDLWAWEVANGFYAFNFNTALEATLAQFGAADPAANNRVVGMLSSNVLVKPLFGKFAVFNRTAVQAETYFTLGVGVIEITRPQPLGNDVSFAPDVGIGFDFWATHHFAVRFDIRNYLAFSQGGLTDVLLIAIGASYNFLEPNAPGPG